MEVDLAKLSHVLAIARTLSFSRAAEELNLTQPALSRSIASMEARFGLRIFDRGRSGVTITPVGALVVAEAQTLVGSARMLGNNLRLYAKGDAGLLAIGMGPLIASMILPGLGSDFLTNSPQLEIRTSIKPPAALLKELLDDAIELAVCATEHIVVPDNVVALRVGEVSFETFARSGHPLAGRSDLTIADFAAYPIARVGDVHMEGPARASGGFICDNYHILQEMVLRSDCIWYTARSFVAPLLADGRLVQLHDDHGPVARSQLAIMCKRGRTRSPAAAMAADFIKKRLASSSGRDLPALASD
jgi:DNA-binding transcriptional LysR family regulator